MVKGPGSLLGAGEFARKGAAVAVPDAAMAPATPPPVESVAPPAVPPAEAASRRSGRIQLGLRLDPERYEQLRVLAFARREPMQTIVERLLFDYLDGVARVWRP